MKVRAGGASFKPVPQGLHIGVCTEVIDLGTQPTEYKGKQKQQRKVHLRFVLPHVLYEEGDRIGQPYSYGTTLTADLSEKANLRKHLESWRGKAFTAAELDEFELSAVLGKPCQMQIIHEVKGDKTYANLKTIVGVPTGTAIPKIADALISFSLDEGEFEPDTFENLPDWQKEKIVASPEYLAAVNGAFPAAAKSDAVDALDDDVPF